MNEEVVPVCGLEDVGQWEVRGRGGSAAKRGCREVERCCEVGWESLWMMEGWHGMGGGSAVAGGDRGGGGVAGRKGCGETVRRCDVAGKSTMRYKVRQRAGEERTRYAL